MKIIFGLILSLTTLASAQDGPIQAKRVASVTWDLQSQKLVWVVQNGVAQNGEFVPSSEERYEISPSEGAMAFGGEQRGFTPQEAAWLQRLLNVLTVYCAESVVWWSNGSGEADRQQEDQEQTTPQAQPSSHPPALDIKPHKVMAPEPRKTPGSVRLIARKMVVGE